MKIQPATLPLPTTLRARRGALLCLLGLGTLLPACTLLGGKPQAPVTTYALEGAAAAAPAAATGAVGQRVLLLAAPLAAPGYDSTRMVYQRQPQTLEAFTQSSWIDTPARMLAPLLLRSLQDSGLLRTQLRAVLQAPSSARADLQLETSILRLQQNFLQQPSSVRFTLQATLTDLRTREVLAWRVLDVAQAAASDDAAGGAAAASAAVQTALQQLQGFLQTSLAALPAPAAWAAPVATP